MKRKLNSCLLWLSFLFAISCQKNDSTPTSTMTFLTNDNSYQYWAVVSDQSGKVLTWKSLPTNVSTSLIYPNDKDPVNLTIIQKTVGANNYTLKTYADVAPGSYSSPSPYQTPTISGTYNVQSLLPSDYNYVVSSECGVTVGNPGYQVDVCANSSLYVSVSKSGTIPRYLYNPQINANGSVTIDQTLYNSLPEMKSKNISLSDSYSTAYSFVGGVKGVNPNWASLSSYSANNTNFATVFYPDQIGSAFDEYNFSLILLKPNLTFTYMSTITNLSDISNYAFQPFTATLDAGSSATTSNLNLNLSGSAHYVSTTFYTSSHNSSWSVINPFSNKISSVLPIFPDDLKKEVDLSFTNTMKVNDVAIGENELNDYQSIYKNAILGQKKVIKNYRNKTYTPRTDGTIGGGG
ncbi:MAG TPA: hypothetical protein VGQ59_11235 [Cyclobacteriaceae bacterium]|jgi:hypothetical protein|nr:hypothetical protein [Cyclobacteriaceae bacterium]